MSLAYDKAIIIRPGLDIGRALMALSNYLALLEKEPDRRERLRFSGACVYTWENPEAAMIVYQTKTSYVVTHA